MTTENYPPSSNKIGAALLSAVGYNEHKSGVETDSLVTQSISVNGQNIVEFQIGQLARNGISKVFLEVEALPGSLVSVADRAATMGVTVKFVRSPAELRGELQSNELLFVLSENVYVDQDVLAEIVKQQETFILTVDGRDENSVFERIDLNNFWTGVAMLSSQSVEAIAALPEDWSISSSLLRRALQDSVTHRPIKQEIVTAKQLCKVTDSAVADVISRRLLVAQSKDTDGIVEKYIFAPLAAAFAPMIWKFNTTGSILTIVCWLGVFATLASAIAAYSVTSAVIGLLTIFILQCKKLVQNARHKPVKFKFIRFLPLLFLMASLLATFWHATSNRQENLYGGIVFCGLMILSHLIVRNELVRSLLCSPALVALTAILFTSAGVFVSGFMLIGLCQLGTLIYISRPDGSFLRG